MIFISNWYFCYIVSHESLTSQEVQLLLGRAGKEVPHPPTGDVANDAANEFPAWLLEYLFLTALNEQLIMEKDKSLK
ncbi:hypothetical protein DPMN_035524 [Dreissena polymorpha]|uniref:Uncharacterized protein n=1 Tax=Dreissena polymorpha TaxID=45954 RepID=A0A9D4RL34_DREPO|nr:hypothetical protein DPMN_035524 [Dreissena polymorpha]